MKTILPIDTNDPEAYEAFTQLLNEIGAEAFSCKQFVSVIEGWRHKEIRLEQDKMPVGMSGYGVGLADCDLACIRPGLSPTQKLGTILHELWHFRRFDIPLLQNGENTPKYDIFIKLRDRHTIVVSRQHDPGIQRFHAMYRNPTERLVETLARLTLKRILYYERQLPEYIQDMYGYVDL